MRERLFYLVQQMERDGKPNVYKKRKKQPDSLLNQTLDKALREKQEVEQKMDGMVRELIKCCYLDQVRHIPALTQFRFDQKLDELRWLEKNHPDLARWYSPVKMGYFNEQFARAAFGDEWDILKRTLDLLESEEYQ